MITDAFLNTERDLSRRIFGYYIDKVVGLMQIGEKDYGVWYKDCLTVNCLMKAIHSLTLVDGVVYLGRSIVGESYFKTLRDNIREYLNAEIRRTVYVDLDITDNNPLISPSEPSIIMSYSSLHRAWESFDIPVPYDNVTTISLPFNISVADRNSLTVTVNDHDPNNLVLPSQEGCHIIGTSLYWHHYFNLKAGDVITIKFLKVSTEVQSYSVVAPAPTASDQWVTNEFADAFEFDGINKTFTFSERFMAGSTQVFNPYPMVPGISYTESLDGFSITFVDAPDPATSYLWWNFKKYQTV